MPISDLVKVDANGITYPDYPTVLDYYKGEFRVIYGDDVYLEADSQDGQWLGVMALAAYDLMQTLGAVYNSFSPLTAQADALSRNVKINGIARKVATHSTADLRIVGQVGATITNGVAQDTLEQKWDLPASVVIPAAGEITVTATAQTIGAISANANTITKIATPTLGWQTVDNVAAATVGAPVESDADLRRRQTESTALPALSVLEATQGGVGAIEGVTRSKIYENDSNTTDADGIPAHTISAVVEGGAVQDIGDVIAKRKTPGTGTYGTTSVTTYDQYGLPNVINFYRPTVATIGVRVTIQALSGYTTDYANLIKTAVATSLNALDIGDDVLISRLYVPANLPDNPAGQTYNITALEIQKDGGGWGTSDIALTFDEVAMTDPDSDVEVVVS